MSLPECMCAVPACKRTVMFTYICTYIHSPQTVMLTFMFGAFKLKRSMYDYNMLMSVEWISLMLLIYVCE